jgi:hypothetical protein
MIDTNRWAFCIEQPIAITEGNVLARDRPGHCVAFDWTALEKVRVLN